MSKAVRSAWIGERQGRSPCDFLLFVAEYTCFVFRGLQDWRAKAFKVVSDNVLTTCAKMRKFPIRAGKRFADGGVRGSRLLLLNSANLAFSTGSRRHLGSGRSSLISFLLLLSEGCLSLCGVDNGAKGVAPPRAGERPPKPLSSTSSRIRPRVVRCCLFCCW